MKKATRGKTKAAKPAEPIEHLLSGEPAESYEFRLYVAGTNLNSLRAIESVRNLCALVRELGGSRCELQIIDLYQQPALAQRDGIVAAPALVKAAPSPRRIFVGDLSNSSRVFAGLGIVTNSRNATPTRRSQ